MKNAFWLNSSYMRVREVSYKAKWKKQSPVTRQWLKRKKHLRSCPQKHGQCTKLTILPPKKPNSARRRICKVYINSTRRRTTCYIPGIGHKLKNYSNVLFRGGRRVDLPGIQYTVIRGVYDMEPMLFRKSARSKYGCKNTLRIRKVKKLSTGKERRFLFKKGFWKWKLGSNKFSTTILSKIRLV